MSWLKTYLHISSKNYLGFIEESFLKLEHTLENIEMKQQFTINREKITKTKELLDNQLKQAK